MTAIVYLLWCGDRTSLYCGWTTDLDARVAKHQAGTGARYTRSHAPVELAWSHVCVSPTQARSLEGLIKQLTPPCKRALAAGDDPLLAALLGRARC